MNNKKMKMARKGTLLRLIKFILTKYLWQVIIVVIAMALSTLTNIAATKNIEKIIEITLNMIETGSTDFSGIVKQLILMASLYLTSIIFTYVHLRIMIDVGQGTLYRLRETLFVHMTKLPVKYFDEHQHGDLMSVFTNDVNATRQMISQSMPQFIIATLTIAGYLTAMFITSYVLSFFMVFVAIVFILTSRYVTSSNRVYYRGQQQSMGKLNGFIEEMVEGQKVVKIFRREQEVIEEFKVLNEDLTAHAKKAGKRIGMLIPFTVSMGYLAYVIVSIIGSYLVRINNITIPQLVLFLLFTRQFIGPFNNLSNQMNFIGMAIAGADRIFKVTDEKVEIDAGKYRLVNVIDNEGVLEITTTNSNLHAWYNEDTHHLVKLSGDARFVDVTFGYNETPVLKDVSLFAKPGQKIAFVGATGAGKTTIANLINRFYDINEGVVMFDGINILDIKKADLRNAIAVVLQDTSLFATTVKENIRYGNLSASDEEVYQAAQNANAHEFILKLPEGYDTQIVDDGANLSQGQRQLLSIARALVANRPVLILDEATSSVDTHTEKLIQGAMDILMKGRTVFVIAHRLSTIQNSNAIIVLEQGKIIERGDHRFLIDSKGKYYELYTGTFEFE